MYIHVYIYIYIYIYMCIYIPSPKIPIHLQKEPYIPAEEPYLPTPSLHVN